MPPLNRSQIITYAQLASGMALFGSVAPVSKIVTEAFPIFIASALRLSLATAILAPFALRHRGESNGMTRRDWAATVVIAVAGIFGVSLGLLFGMRYVSGVFGSIILSTEPAITAAAAWLFLRDRLDWHKAAAVALSVAGVLILHLGGQEQGEASQNILLGGLLLFGVVCGDVAYTLLAKVVLKHISPTVLAAITTALAVPMFVPLALLEIGRFDPSTVTATEWLALGWYGTAGMVLGAVLWCRGVQKVPGSTAAGFMAVMPVSALVLSYGLLGEPFRLIHLAGFGAVLLGVGLITWAHAREERQTSAPMRCGATASAE